MINSSIEECVCASVKSASEGPSETIEIPTIESESVEECRTLVQEVPIKSDDWNYSLKTTRNEHDDEHDINGCLLWGNNWRQFTSVLPGILLLFAVGFHNVFTVYEVDRLSASMDLVKTFKSKHEPNQHHLLDDIYVLTQSSSELTDSRLYLWWYGGAVIGGLFAAVFVRYLRKRTIYVSEFNLFVNGLTAIFMFIVLLFSVFRSDFTSYRRFTFAATCIGEIRICFPCMGPRQ